jgi:small-conductance mechanosensitive channel
MISPAFKALLQGIFLAILFMVPAALAQQASSERALEELTEIENRLDSIVENIDALSIADAEIEDRQNLNENIAALATLRNELSGIERRALSIRSQSKEALDAVSNLVPADEVSGDEDENSQGSGASSESGDANRNADALAEGALSGVTAPYREINRRASVAAADARLAEIDARRTFERLTQTRDTVFVASILERAMMPLQPGVWPEAIESTDNVWAELVEQADEWRQTQISKGIPYPVLIVVGVSLLLLAGLLWLYWIFYRWETQRINERRPSRQTVATVAMTSFLLRFSTAVALVIAVTGVTYLFGLRVLDGDAGRSIAFVTVAILCMRALVASVIAPRTPSFRLIGVGDKAAKAISLSFIVLVFAFAIESVLAATGALATPSDALVAARTFSLALLSGGLLTWLAIRVRARTESGKSRIRVALRWLTFALAGTIIVTSLAGYHYLSRFVIERIVLLSIVLLIGILAREFVRATALKVLSGVVERRRYASARESESDADGGPELNSEFWIKVSVDTLVVLALPPFLLLALGMPVDELWNEIRWLLAGFQVGGQRISLGAILAAILTIIAVMLATRIIQRTLHRQILPKSRISSGAADSLVTLLGYAGVIIAMVTAIGVVGFDLSSLAIIAGALSVGIGFGLQSIVSNFVAGLILLFERPFKTGDWIVTPSGEGTVQKINVRATEVLTFDRRSIIVPNAELVSNAFGNWTHKSDVMRVAIEVGVKYGTDTRKVEKALLEIAEKVEYIRKDPPPYVVLKEFDDSSVNFELRGYIVVDHIVIAPSEIKHEIAVVFEREGITIPFPQRDVHFDWPDAPKSLQQDDPDDEDDGSQSESGSEKNEQRAASEKEEAD